MPDNARPARAPRVPQQRPDGNGGQETRPQADIDSDVAAAAKRELEAQEAAAMTLATATRDALSASDQIVYDAIAKLDMPDAERAVALATFAARATAKPTRAGRSSTVTEPAHDADCNTLREHAVDRATFEQNLLDLATAVDPMFQDMALASIPGKVAAEYDCNCALSRRKAPGVRSANGTTNKLTAKIADGKLSVVWGDASSTFDLPDASDKTAVKALKTAALAWYDAATGDAATVGQRNALVKKLTDNGYRVGGN